MKIKRTHLIAGIATLLGAGGGFLYWQQIGCLSGSCPITSSPTISSMYGGVMAYLLVGIVLDFTKKDKQD